MSLESATYISQLDAANPPSGDPVSQADDHIRLVKSTVKATFPNITGAVTATQSQLNNPLLATTPTTDTMPYYVSGVLAGTTSLTAYGRTLCGLANADALKTNLGLGTMAYEATTTYMPYAGGAFTGGISGTTASFSGAVSGASFAASGALSGSSATISSTGPIITLADTDWGNRYLHAQGGLMGFLSSGVGWTMYVDNGGNLVATGNVTAYSDARLKKDVTPIKAATSLVKRMNGYWYTRKDSGAHRVGVLAQDMQEIVPEVVHEGADGILSVAYGDLVAVLIESIKELEARITELEANAVGSMRTG